MANPTKRLPICALLAFGSALTALLLFGWMWNPPSFLQDNTGHSFFFIELFMLLGCGCAFVFAVLALARRERFSALPVSALIVVLAIIALILGAMVLLSQHMEGR